MQYLAYQCFFLAQIKCDEMRSLYKRTNTLLANKGATSFGSDEQTKCIVGNLWTASDWLDWENRTFKRWPAEFVFLMVYVDVNTFFSKIQISMTASKTSVTFYWISFEWTNCYLYHSHEKDFLFWQTIIKRSYNLRATTCFLILLYRRREDLLIFIQLFVLLFMIFTNTIGNCLIFDSGRLILF